MKSLTVRTLANAIFRAVVATTGMHGYTGEPQPYVDKRGGIDDCARDDARRRAMTTARTRGTSVCAYIAWFPRPARSRRASRRAFGRCRRHEWVGKTLKPRAREGLGRERAQAWTKEPRVRA